MTRYGKTMSMLALGAMLAGSAFGSALAQNQTAGSDGDQSNNLLNRHYLTSTGQVVPKPGALKGLPQTPPDQKAQHKEDAILNSICSNC